MQNFNILNTWPFVRLTKCATWENFTDGTSSYTYDNYRSSERVHIGLMLGI